MERTVHKCSKKTRTVIKVKKRRTKPIIQPRKIFRCIKHGVIYELKRDIQSCNKYLSNQYLKRQTPFVLLCNVHPNYRMEYAVRCLDKKLITKRQYNCLKPQKQ